MQLAADNGWEGIIVYGAVRQIDQLENIDIGIQALAPIPVSADEQTSVVKWMCPSISAVFLSYRKISSMQI